MATFTTQEMKEAIQNWINRTSNPGKFRLSDMEPMHGGNVQCTLYCYENAKRMEFSGHFQNNTPSDPPTIELFFNAGEKRAYYDVKILYDFNERIPEFVNQIDDPNMLVIVGETNDNVKRLVEVMSECIMLAATTMQRK